MRRQQVIELLAPLEQELRGMGVRSLRLFGSVARDQANESSDVDLLVEFAESPTFAQFMALRIQLEDLLGARVDLVTTNGLRDRVRPFVEEDAILVA